MSGRQKMRDEDDLEQVVFDDEDAGLPRSHKGHSRGQSGRGSAGASGSGSVHASAQMMHKIRSRSPRSTSSGREGEAVEDHSGGNQPAAASSSAGGNRSRGVRQRSTHFSASRSLKAKGATKAETEIFTEFEELEAEALAAKTNQVNASSPDSDSAARGSSRKDGSPSPTISSSTSRLPRKRQRSKVCGPDEKTSPSMELSEDDDDTRAKEIATGKAKGKGSKEYAGMNLAEEDSASGTSASGSRNRSSQRTSTLRSKSAAPSDRAPALTKTGGQPELGIPSSWGRPTKKAAATARGNLPKATQKGRMKGGVSASAKPRPTLSPPATDMESRQQARARKLRRVDDVDPSNPDFFGNIPVRAATRGDRASKRSRLERNDTIVEEAGADADADVDAGAGAGAGAGFSFGNEELGKIGASASAPGYGASSFAQQAQAQRHPLDMSQHGTQGFSRSTTAPPSTRSAPTSSAFGFGAAAPPPAVSPSHHRQQSTGGGAGRSFGGTGSRRGWGSSNRVPESKHRTLLASVARKAVDQPTKLYYYQAQGPRSLDMADPRNLATTYMDVMLVRQESLVDPPLVAYLCYVLPQGVTVRQRQSKRHSPSSSPTAKHAGAGAGAGAEEKRDDGNDDTRPALLAAPTQALNNTCVYAIMRSTRDTREDKLEQKGVYRVYDPVVKWVTVAGDQHSTGPEPWRSKITLPVQPQGVDWGVTEPVHFPCLYAMGLLERNTEVSVDENRLAAVQNEAQWWPPL